VVAVERNVRDVDRAPEDHDGTRTRHADTPEHRGSKLHDRAEDIVRGPDVIGVVHPDTEADTRAPPRLGRQRSPADVVIRFAPRNPSRTPLVVGHPNPADIIGPHPATVVIANVAKVLVADPGPTG